MEKIQKYVRNNACDIGFAFDGDGDRVLCVNREGSLIDGDRMIYLLASALKDQEMLSHNTVVLTKMSNLGIIKALKHKGIDCIETPVGDKYVLEAMDQGGYVLGGENSGHIINRSYLSTGDGVLNALAILSLLEQRTQSIDDLLEPVQLYPETLSNLRGYDPAVLKRESVKKIILDLTHALGSEGKILVRPSGTEPLIRIMVSAQTQAQVDYAIHSIEIAIKTESQINTSPL
jgi:phosphoglucosamine mutase